MKTTKTIVAVTSRQINLLIVLKKAGSGGLTKSDIRAKLKVTSIFAMLQRLRENGLVEGYEIDGEADVWAITSLGKKFAVKKAAVKKATKKAKK